MMLFGLDAAPRDAYFVAFQIAEYAKSNDFNMILCGRESIDYNGSQVAAMIGEFLDIPSDINHQKTRL
jgi:electron transfer flavoprotein beta subunit